MTMMPLARSLALAAAVGLGACVSVLPTAPPPDAYYTLTSGGSCARHAGPTSPVRGQVAVSLPEAARLIAGREIALTARDGGLVTLAGARWADDLPDLLRGCLIDALNGQGWSGQLAEVGARVNRRLEWQIERFELAPDAAAGAPQARVRVRALLLDERRNVLSETVAEHAATAASRSPAAMLAAMGEAAEAASTTLAQWVAAS